MRCALQAPRIVCWGPTHARALHKGCVCARTALCGCCCVWCGAGAVWYWAGRAAHTVGVTGCVLRAVCVTGCSARVVCVMSCAAHTVCVAGCASGMVHVTGCSAHTVCIMGCASGTLCVTGCSAHTACVTGCVTTRGVLHGCGGSALCSGAAPCGGFPGSHHRAGVPALPRGSSAPHPHVWEQRCTDSGLHLGEQLWLCSLCWLVSPLPSPHSPQPRAFLLKTHDNLK